MWEGRDRLFSSIVGKHVLEHHARGDAAQSIFRLGGSIFSEIVMGRYRRLAKYTIGAAWALVGGVLLAGTARGVGFDTITVRVRVNSANAFGACWDSWCGKPDLFVIFYGTGTSSQAPVCKSNTVVDRVNVGNPAPPDWRCDFVVKRPGKLFIGLFDGDGPNQDNTQAEQVDISPGPEKSVGVDLENLARGQGMPVDFESQGDDAKISYTVSAVINPSELQGFSADRTTFQPSIGQQIQLTATANGAPYTLLRIHAYNSVGAETWSIFGYLDTPGQIAKQFVWQGRDPNGNPLPPGTYTLKLSGFDSTTNEPAIGILPNGTKAVGGQLLLPITIMPAPALPSLAVPGIDPSPKWAPEVGDLGVRVVSSANANVSGEVFSAGDCTGPKLADLGSITVEPLRPDKLTWNGTTSAGTTVSVGTVGIKVSGTSNGAATSPASVCNQLQIVTAPPVSSYMRHVPFLPDPGQTVELTANAVDPSGAPRIVGRLDVWGSVQSIPGAAPTPPTSPLKTCVMATTCTATINLPQGGSFLTWRATAEDRGGTTIATFGWRGQRVTDGPSFANASLLSVPVDEALNGSSMADAPDSAKTFDLLFSVSTDFDWTSATDRQTIGSALDQFMIRLWGISGAGAPALTTFMTRPDLVRVFITPERPLVSWTPPANLCDWSVPSSSWADATAVLHKTDCRDNADPSSRSFSAKLLARDVIFHELHHALFGLADEYPAGDGGYFEAQPDPNIYNTLASCMADSLFKTGGCSSITEIDVNTRVPTGRTFFRLDNEATDVMIGNSTQRAADIRRAKRKEGQCDAGGC